MENVIRQYRGGCLLVLASSKLRIQLHSSTQKGPKRKIRSKNSFEWLFQVQILSWVFIPVFYWYHFHRRADCCPWIRPTIISHRNGLPSEHRDHPVQFLKENGLEMSTSSSCSVNPSLSGLSRFNATTKWFAEPGLRHRLAQEKDADVNRKN
jgi:hypothetical protein